MPNLRLIAGVLVGAMLLSTSANSASTSRILRGHWEFVNGPITIFKKVISPPTPGLRFMITIKNDSKNNKIEVWQGDHNLSEVPSRSSATFLIDAANDIIIKAAQPSDGEYAILTIVSD